MKIRQGFVSNSSSSSFCIYGVELEIVDIKKYLPDDFDQSLEGEDEISEEMYERGIEWYDIASKIRKALGDNFSCFADWECSRVYIGRELTGIGDKETGAEFKASVEQKIEDVIDESYQCSFIEETIQS